MLHALRRHASLVVIFLIAVTAGLATLQLRGAEAFMAALWHAWELFLFIVPSLVAGLLLAAALRQLLSPDALARLMGAESGIFGLFIATLVGTLSPGGRMAAFPLVLVMARAVRAWARPAFRCQQSNGRSLINEGLSNFEFPMNLIKNLTISFQIKRNYKR